MREQEEECMLVQVVVSFPEHGKVKGIQKSGEVFQGWLKWKGK
jgi:hypothetical protein